MSSLFSNPYSVSSVVLSPASLFRPSLPRASSLPLAYPILLHLPRELLSCIQNLRRLPRPRSKPSLGDSCDQKNKQINKQLQRKQKLGQSIQVMFVPPSRPQPTLTAPYRYPRNLPYVSDQFSRDELRCAKKKQLFFYYSIWLLSPIFTKWQKAESQFFLRRCHHFQVKNNS